MATYEVTFIGEIYIRVEAENHDEAFDKAWDAKDNLGFLFKVRDARTEEV